MTHPPTYSVIVPVYNSQSSLAELFEGIRNVFTAMGQTYEVIFVDDNSYDNSWNILSDLKRKFPSQIGIVRLSRNFGQHNATLCGLNYARGRKVITIDDDLQTPPAEIKKLLEYSENSDAELIYGIYGRKKHTPARNLGSKSLKKTAKVFHNSYGEGSSFRLIDGNLVKKILHHHQHFIFLDEILLWYTDRPGFTEVDHQPRKYDQSGYTLGKLVRLFTNLVLYYTMVPLKVLVYGGFLFSMITFVYGLFSIFKKLVFDVPLGYTSLIVAILFSTSIILFSLGVLGEYLSRIYQLQNGKPAYSIRQSEGIG